ncbi:MAG: tRNA epoxyqueuosine(34) reductase QueG [Bacteroidales bacterium]|nr:tRNA epoxyqueuosine(34) reductase QueG [Bacteroidales bacterium]
MNSLEITNFIKAKALELGFDACGIASAEPLDEEKNNLKEWLAKGYHAGMEWMNNHFDKRANPRMLVEGTRSIIVVLKNYTPVSYPFAHRKYKIARYALGLDYHKVVKKQLNQLLSAIQLNIGEQVQGRCFVDSAPVMERVWAHRAGLGWIGKNSLLINRKLGSYCFIGEIFLNIDLVYDRPINNLCGTCTYCIDACPTGAIVAPMIVDANRCISYHTIENKHEIDESVKNKMKGWIFGCDICQEVCPWNFRITPHREPAFEPSPDLRNFTDEHFENLTEETYQKLFAHSAVKRAKYPKLLQNIKINQCCH